MGMADDVVISNVAKAGRRAGVGLPFKSHGSGGLLPAKVDSLNGLVAVRNTPVPRDRIRPGRPKAAEWTAAGKQLSEIGRIEAGLKVGVIGAIASELGIPVGMICRLVKISSSTFNRRQRTGVLSAEESDRVFRLRLIFEKTKAFFEGNKVAARQWLTRPAPAFHGFRPVDLLVNEAGVREVESLLNRLDYGVFS